MQLPFFSDEFSNFGGFVVLSMGPRTIKVTNKDLKEVQNFMCNCVAPADALDIQRDTVVWKMSSVHFYLPAATDWLIYSVLIMKTEFYNRNTPGDS